MTALDPLEELLRPPTPKPKDARGFASMDKEQQREIARKGGMTTQARGNAHKFTPEETSRGGKVGGQRGRAGKGPRRKQAQGA